MNNNEKTYVIERWNGGKCELIAQELYERVLRDSESDYNWIASAQELVRVVNEPDFPKMYKENIQIIILNCFANLEAKESHFDLEEQNAVYDCYYSLPNTNEEAKEVKLKYLTAIVSTILKECNIFSWKFHTGKRYETICRKWKKVKVKECFSAKEINLETLKSELANNFLQTIEEAEKKGIFDEAY